MNESELEYPLMDGTKVKFEIHYDEHDGLDKAVPGNVVLCHMVGEDEDGNHYMELESIDENGVAIMQNSEDGFNHERCPSDVYDEVLCNSKITTSDPEVVC
eukprot:gnl/MRDRNA2_/MRDRNA2_160555_c0_seq1.p1 gnl/MRDRNA2_/MRDRNA2_160555_c0~~gnl/MRDRNA2_/MRDRNA2_160555_c0_seq1.p1  ORF type:complete len:101 (+),score=14.68 gnl/MRDRNA2_/MRDRNA2_160555_c0_seq1:2-304(+)